MCKVSAEKMAYDLVPFVQAYLTTKAAAEVLREKVDNWTREELARFEYHTAHEWIERGRPERITEPKDTHLMSDDDFRELMNEKHEWHKTIGFGDLEYGCCPALIAESACCDAAHLLINRACEILDNGATLQDLLCNMKAYHKMIDLLCGMACSTGKVENLLKEA